LPIERIGFEGNAGERREGEKDTNRMKDNSMGVRDEDTKETDFLQRTSI
jgi:hypothetical protein